MGSMSIWHWVVVIAVVLLLFGRGKISELMGDVAQGIKSFKKGISEDEEEAKPARAAQKVIEHKRAAPARAKSTSRAKSKATRKSS